MATTACDNSPVCFHARIEHLLDMSEAHMEDIETAMEEPASSNQEEAGGDDFQQPPATEVKAAR